MRGKGVAYQVIGFWLLLFAPLHAQEIVPAVIEGRIISEETDEPLSGAHIFLSGTKIGTVSNEAGRYRLSRVPPGSHRLVFSIIGYDRRITDIMIAPGESLTENAELKPAVYELEEIYAGNLDDKWEKHLERFTMLFLGESERADSVKILNPEVLRFQKKWWGRFTAEALAPLEIENYALGYRIIYYLDEFRHSGTTTRWDGEPLYSEMTPADSSQAKYWEQNRQKAFRGSMRHFFIALIEDRAEEEGFTIYNYRQTVRGISTHDKIRTRSSRLLKKTDEDHLYNMQFSGRLEIIYSKAGEDPRYVRWARELNRGPATTQTSYLELNERPITIDLAGDVAEPYGVTRSGYLGFRRIADQTPKEYRMMNKEF